jgi:integrase/recombinase XerD
MTTVNKAYIIDLVTKALKEEEMKAEPSVDFIRKRIPDFIEAGLSGELTGKSWSYRYCQMQRYYLDKYLQEAIALGLELNPIEPRSVRKILNSNKRSVTEKRNRYASIKSFVDFLVLHGKLPKSRSAEIQSLRPKQSAPFKKRFISKEDLDLINQNIRSSKYTNEYDKELLITVIKLVDETGLRIGEISSIKLCDLNLENSELYIPRAKGGFDFTKGLNDEAINSIKQYLKVRPKTENLNLFVLDNGEPVKRDSLIQRFRRITKKLGLDTSFHAIRRRYITRHLQDGKSLVDVSLAVNHKSPRMTEQYLIPDVRRSIEAQKKW